MKRALSSPVIASVIFIGAVSLGWLLIQMHDVPGALHPAPPFAQPPESVPQLEAPAAPVLGAHQYIEIIDSCSSGFDGAECVRARAGPGTSYKVVGRLRNGVVLKVDGSVESGGRTWYRVVFDEWLRYPDRATRVQYVAGEYTRVFEGNGIEHFSGTKTGTKHILVDRSDQKLFAFDGDTLFMEAVISTGLELTPTPRGNFIIYKKTPTRYMQGPIPGISKKEFDLPGVPWNLYFTKQGGVIHGAYWHEKFGQPASNGCVNLTVAEAEKLYRWADIGTPVHVRD